MNAPYIRVWPLSLYVAKATETDCPRFPNQEMAESWLDKEMEDENWDNFRFSFLEDTDGCLQYEAAYGKGCCGSFDEVILVDGRAALIGCNYGH
jgi:hypothetical protein